MVEKLFPDETIIKTKYFRLEQDWEIPIPGFLIIASLGGVKSVTDFTEEESQEFIKLVVKARKGMKEVLGINDVYLYQNEATEHSFHLWMFPRHKWMGKIGTGIESVRPIMNYSKENMVNEETIKKVKEDVEKMREYMKDF